MQDKKIQDLSDAIVRLLEGIDYVAAIRALDRAKRDIDLSLVVLLPHYLKKG
jgi:hypothetical protein